MASYPACGKPPPPYTQPAPLPSGRADRTLTRQCLDRRIDTAEFLGSEVNAWQASRNAIDSEINWQFTTSDARIKLRRLYPEYLRTEQSLPTPKPTRIHN